MNYNSLTKDDFFGEVIIPVSQFSSQEVIEEWFELNTKDGKPVDGRILLSIQWVYSRVKYLKEIIISWEEHIATEKNEQIEFQYELNSLQELIKKKTKSIYNHFQDLGKSIKETVNKDTNEMFGFSKHKLDKSK